MADTTRAQDELADLEGEFAAAGATKGMIFGHRALKTAARKVFCFEHGDALVFKLDAAAQADALALPGTSVFKPMADRPAMRGWVVVPDSQADEWPALAHAAYDYVSELTDSGR